MIEAIKKLFGFGADTVAPDNTNPVGWEEMPGVELPPNLQQMGKEGIAFIESLPDEAFIAMSQNNRDYLMGIYAYLKKNS